MNPTDIAGWTACAVAILGLILYGAGLRRTGRALMLAGLLTAIASAVAAGASPWWCVPLGVLAGWNAVEFGRELRKGGAK